MILRFNIDEEIIVKDFLKKQGISRVLGRKIHLYGKYRINSMEAKNWHTLKVGDVLEIEYQEEQNQAIVPSNFPINVLYEDDYLMIVDKPNNLASQPSRKHYLDNLVSRTKQYFLDHGIMNNIHIVTRLDYATSGLVIIAKDGYIHHKLSEIDITKKYLAIVNGEWEKAEGTIDLPIEREAEDSIKRTVTENGKKSITKYKLIKKNNKYSMLELDLETGRCHQIRVHLSHLNFPIRGDKLYGTEDDFLYLHSYYLNFIHPITKECIEVFCYPDWYELFIKQ